MPYVGDSIYPRNAGRQVIYTDVETITPQNVITVMSDSLLQFQETAKDIDYLYEYYKGNQPVLSRMPLEEGNDICNKVVVNLANEIVTFKTSYLLYQPIQYTNIDDTASERGLELVNRLNRVMDASGKAPTDVEIANWLHICGTSYRFVFPDNGNLMIQSLDPRCTFVVYSSEVPHRPMMGVFFVTKQNGDIVYNVYTADSYYRIESKAMSSEPYTITMVSPLYLQGDIPVIEYPADMSRMGSFEVVLQLLDAVNEATSDRLDSVQSFVHSLLVITGAGIEDEDEFWASIRRNRGITLPEGAKAEYIAQELKQEGVQTMVDHMIDVILRIVGMPQRTGGASTSDNGVAVILRDGYSDASSRAKATELMFKKSEHTFLRIATHIMRTTMGIDVDPNDIGIQFGRNNYENIQSKAQVLTTLLGCDKIAPKLAFEHCGMFNDPALAYAESKEYYDAKKAEEQAELNRLTQMRTEESLDGSDEDVADV